MTVELNGGMVVVDKYALFQGEQNNNRDRVKHKTGSLVRVDTEQYADKEEGRRQWQCRKHHPDYRPVELVIVHANEAVIDV